MKKMTEDTVILAVLETVILAAVISAVAAFVIGISHRNAVRSGSLHPGMSIGTVCAEDPETEPFTEADK